MTKQLSLLLAVLCLTYLSCQKEYSLEGNASVVSDGSLQSDVGGNCLGTTVSGTYKADSTLNPSHFADVTIIVNRPGSYLVNTDTVNGFYFRAAGTFTGTGAAVVRMQATGKPILAGTFTFNVRYDSTVCSFNVTVVPSGGAGGSAVFTLIGAPNTCTSAVVSGTYTVGTALIGTNTVAIQVNVTSAGSYSISTSVINGISFSASGNFVATGGPQIITLAGTGTPAAAGTFSYPVTAGTSTCSFDVTAAGVVTASDYFPRTANSNWSYEINDNATDSLLRVVITPTHNALGNVYNIFAITNNASQGFDSSGYYRKSGGDYFGFLDIGAYYGFDSPLWAETIFLKDNVPLGTVWYTAGHTGTVTGVGQVTIRTKYSIFQKDVSVAVNGTNYPNTIVVLEQYEAFLGGIWTDLTSAFGLIKSYYSRNIGLVLEEYYDGTNALDTKIEIRRYTVF